MPEAAKRMHSGNIRELKHEHEWNKFIQVPDYNGEIITRLDKIEKHLKSLVKPKNSIIKIATEKEINTYG